MTSETEEETGSPFVREVSKTKQRELPIDHGWAWVIMAGNYDKCTGTTIY
jgi:hypothetical protein